MSEYFVFSNSFAAPFMSDSSTKFVEGESPRAALEAFVKSYSHPAGLYFAALYPSADAYHKDYGKPLITWTCNHDLELKRRAKELKGGYSLLGKGPGEFELNGKNVSVEKPKEGQFSDAVAESEAHTAGVPQ